MASLIPLTRPGAEVGSRHETRETFEVEPFDLYGRQHEITEAEADVAVTRLSEGLHLNLRVRVVVHTTCDRTLEPTELQLEFGDSERSEEHTSELQSRQYLVCRLLLEKKNI